jgi:hypothetical protein
MHPAANLVNGTGRRFTARGAWRRLSLVMAVVLLAPLLVALAGPASPAAAATGPSPIPGGLWDANPAVGAGQSYVVIDGTPGDPVTQGTDHLYTQADSVIGVAQSSGLVTVTVGADQSWGGGFKAMAGVDPAAVGYYPNVTRYPFHDSTVGGMSWSGFSGCNTLTGWFAIDDIAMVVGSVSRLTLRFSQSCDGGPAIFGKVRFLASDPTQVPGPQAPVPGGLWDTTPAVPAGTNYLALDSTPGDPWLGGGSRLFVSGYSGFSLEVEPQVAAPDNLALFVTGDQRWITRFQPMASLSSLEVGYYPDVTDLSSGNPARGRMSLFGPSTCSSLPQTGWMAVDEITRSQGAITSLSLRFEFSCAGAPPIHGKVRWFASDLGLAPGPQPIPGDLWDAQPSVGPTQSYVTLSAPAGEPITGGIDQTLTMANSRITVAESSGALDVTAAGDRRWTGKFVPMNIVSALEPGYYPGAVLAPGNTRRPTFAWVDAAKAPCAAATGWFAVDEITRSQGAIAMATIRFGLSCDGIHTLNGKIHWNASDPTVPSGPVTPVPGGLWDVTPSGVTGDYLFLDGVVGDPLTNGDDVLVSGPGSHVNAGDAQGRIDGFAGTPPQLAAIYSFDGVDSLGTVQPGYYPNLSTATQDNPVLGGVAFDRVVNSQKVP